MLIRIKIVLCYMYIMHLTSGKEISSTQYTLECNRVLHFEVGQAGVCHNYSITNDEMCELGANATQFKLQLSLSSTDRLRIKSSLSETMVTTDDSQEPAIDRLPLANKLK